MALSADRNRRTIGIAAKVGWPAVALVALGVITTVVGAAIENHTVLSVGLTLLGSPAVVGVLGYLAPAPITAPRSDDPTTYRGGPR